MTSNPLPLLTREELENRSMTIEKIKTALNGAGISTDEIKLKKDYVQLYLDSQPLNTPKNEPTKFVTSKTPKSIEIRKRKQLTPENPNDFYFRVISPDLNSLILSNLSIFEVIKLCNDKIITETNICSNELFWTRYYFHRFGKSYKPSKDHPTVKFLAEKVYETYSKIKNSKSKDDAIIEANNGLLLAAEYGMRDETQIFIDMGAYDYDFAMKFAAQEGHIDIVKLMVKLGAKYYDWVMEIAASGGYIDIVELMLSKGASDYNGTMRCAAYGGHIDIVKLMLSKGADDYNTTMINAALGGHIDIVNLMIELGANNYNHVMTSAASGGHIDIVKLMIEKGANNYDDAIGYAAIQGYVDIVELLLSKGIKNYKNAIENAKVGKHMDVVKLIEQHVVKLIEQHQKTNKSGARKK